MTALFLKCPVFGLYPFLPNGFERIPSKFVLTKFEKKKAAKNPNVKSDDETSWKNHARKQKKVVSRDPIILISAGIEKDDYLPEVFGSLREPYSKTPFYGSRSATIFTQMFNSKTNPPGRYEELRTVLK
ncbi:hypothetical protein OUZ56_018820 [Daphnia magna]|uniref:Uncharacterized protein n=1 Tax=Daphnia magna TaxID=35525 RepID=A0ABQ9Z9U0_9CRUS|nr:hypothetical protein OUZ56_018820 [Daphnia magna]